MGLIRTRNAGAYEIDKICYRALHDLAFRARLIDDLAAATADLDLPEAHRAALLEGDVGGLARFGVSTFLLSYLPRWNIARLTIERYSERMRMSEPLNK